MKYLNMLDFLGQLLLVILSVPIFRTFSIYLSSWPLILNLYVIFPGSGCRKTIVPIYLSELLAMASAGGDEQYDFIWKGKLNKEV